MGWLNYWFSKEEVEKEEEEEEEEDGLKAAIAENKLVTDNVVKLAEKSHTYTSNLVKLSNDALAILEKVENRKK